MQVLEGENGDSVFKFEHSKDVGFSLQQGGTASVLSQSARMIRRGSKRLSIIAVTVASAPAVCIREAQQNTPVALCLLIKA